MEIFLNEEKKGIIMIIRLKGVIYNNAQQHIKELSKKKNKEIYLEREPNNIHDSNAIQVKWGDKFLGYIPTNDAQRIAPLIDSGIEFKVYFVKINKSSYHETVGLTVEIEEVTQSKSSNSVIIELAENVHFYL
ncbi:MAG: HIRAN domain-containing protein [Deltaproteobacteria bacterium]|nr:HIRAN domain-containing protein [Deltaproteobacteria bacterium]